MKLLDKLKNTFFEEEYVELEEPEVKKQEVAKKIEPKETKKEEVNSIPIAEKVTQVDENEKIENYSEGELSRKNSKLPYFEEEDFVETVIDSEQFEEPKKIYGESVDKLYSSINYSNTTVNKPYSALSKETFKPTPIISPIYGILDKNYRKEEVVDKKEKLSGVSSYVSRKNADLDSVRKKAYGGLEPFEEVSKSLSNVSDKEMESEEENLFYDMTEEHAKPRVDQVTIADAEEYFEDLGLEYNIDYKDTHYEKATGRRVSSTVSEEKENINESEEVAGDENLFEIIDSIYEEGEE